jgi:hypothetical protein
LLVPEAGASSIPRPRSVTNRLSASAVVAEDLAQRRGERVRVALHAEFAAKETGVVVGEDHGLGSESLRHGHRGAVGHFALGLGSGSRSGSGSEDDVG